MTGARRCSSNPLERRRPLAKRFPHGDLLAERAADDVTAPWPRLQDVGDVRMPGADLTKPADPGWSPASEILRDDEMTERNL
jgi:hypothetical protein